MIGHYPPFRPSNLRVPTGPSSPASPLSPPPMTARSPILFPVSTATGDWPCPSSPPPPSPLPWIWYCHMCHNHYPLGATRRCLHDGHQICFRPTEKVNKRTGKVKQPRPCTTEFDYGGWRARNEWRRRHFPAAQPKHEPRTRDCCRKCDYPSHCNSLDRSVPGTPIVDPLCNHHPRSDPSPAPWIVNDPRSPPAPAGPCTTFEQLLGLQAPVNRSTSPAEAPKRLSWIMKAVETRGAQLATLLSPVQEEPWIRPPKPKTSTPDNTAVSRPRSNPTGTGASDSNPTHCNPAAAAVEDFVQAPMDRIHGSSSGGGNEPNPMPDSPRPRGWFPSPTVAGHDFHLAPPIGNRIPGTGVDGDGL